jgi:outer membrane protein OmpA-like peptidoglycan-associated protein
MNVRKSTTLAALFLVTTGLTSGCVATRKFVRNSVGASSSDITAKMDAKDQDLQNGIKNNSDQIGELTDVSKEHTEQISSLDTGLKSTDQKAGQAMQTGQQAQSSATQASNHVNALDQKFQNRNHLTVLSEESVPFKFNSATLDKDHTSALDQVAQQIKGNPDAVLVLEGHTDSVGDANYNIQLGERRLDSVIRYLVVQQGVPMNQIYRMSFGEDHPVTAADTRNKDARAQNRVVIIRLMGPSESSSNGQTVSQTSGSSMQ